MRWAVHTRASRCSRARRARPRARCSRARRARPRARGAAVLLHFTRETRPWQHPPRNGSEWFDGCVTSVCIASGGRGGGGRAIGRLGALHPERRAWCARRLHRRCIDVRGRGIVSELTD